MYIPAPSAGYSSRLKDSRTAALYAGAKCSSTKKANAVRPKAAAAEAAGLAVRAAGRANADAWIRFF